MSRKTNIRISEANKRTPWLLLLVLLGGFWLRVYRLGEQSLTWDELSTIARATIPIADMFDNLFTIRNHMPLYFLLMRGWVAIGEEEFIVRYFSLVMGLISLVLIYKVGRRLGDKWNSDQISEERQVSGQNIGLVAAFLLAITPFHIWYSQETRMYTLLAASTIAAHWFLLRIIQYGQQGKVLPASKWNWTGYTIAMVIALYSHYLALFILVAHYVYFSLHYRWMKPLFRNWLYYGGVAGLIFAIWAGFIMLTGGLKNAPISWIEPANWYEPLLSLLSLSAGPTIDPTRTVAYVILVVYLVALVACVLKYNRRLGDDDTRAWPRKIFTVRLLILWLIVPPLLIFLISLDWPVPQNRSIYMDRYLIIVLPALLLLVAWGLLTLTMKRPWILPVILLLIVLFTIPALRNLYFDPLYSREAWRTALAQVQEDWQSQDILLTQPGQELPLFYYGDRQIDSKPIPSFDPNEKPGMNVDVLIAEWMEEISSESGRVWLIWALDNADAHGFPQERNSAISEGELNSRYEKWMADNYEQLGDWTFAGIRMTLFDVSTGR